MGEKKFSHQPTSITPPIQHVNKKDKQNNFYEVTYASHASDGGFGWQEEVSASVCLPPSPLLSSPSLSLFVFFTFPTPPRPCGAL